MSLDIIGLQIKSPVCQEWVIFFEVVCFCGCSDPQTLQAIASTLISPLELSSKTLLLKTPHT